LRKSFRDGFRKVFKTKKRMIESMFCGTLAMTNQEYERLYAEALEVVKHKHVDRTVGHPERTAGGYPSDDAIVFAMAWDERAALDILNRKPR
jgi:hypothetical protein